MRVIEPHLQHAHIRHFPGARATGRLRWVLSVKRRTDDLRTYGGAVAVTVDRS
jgi:hypothetical protein